MTHPRPLDESTPTSAPGDGAPEKQHGDPLLAASQGATEGTEGSRHGDDAAAGTEGTADGSGAEQPA